jgi:Ca-activated chloride channel family protein
MRWLAFTLVVAATGGTAAEQTAQRADDELGIQVDEVVEVGLQQLYVTVTNRRGERVVDLGPEAFRVSDRGRPQEIVTFEGGDIPITAVLVVDSSQSMEGLPLEAARSGTEAFANGMRELDEASVLLFSDRLLVRTPFANSPAEIVAGLAELEAVGGSAVHDHLYLALKLLEERQGRRVVLLLSDGVDAHSAVAFDQVANVARVSQSLVYWVRVRPRYTLRANNMARMSWVEPHQGERSYHGLERLVTRSGGRVVEIDTILHIEWAFREVLAELREQYAIGYYPDPSHSGSGEFREVEVRVQGEGLEVRTRDGYVDR